VPHCCAGDAPELRGRQGARRRPRPASTRSVALVARSRSLMKNGPAPAFLLARAFAPTAPAWLAVSRDSSSAPETAVGATIQQPD